MTWALPAIAVVVLAYATVSRRLEGSSITPAIVFTGVGLLIGARVAGLLDAEASNTTVRHLAEATLAVVLFTDAARIDLRALRAEYRVPARLLGIGLPLTIAAGFLAALAVVPSLAWPEALLLAVVLAPTDAALGEAVVSMSSLPSRIRQGLNVESGLNDGLCVPVFGAALALASTEAGAVSGRHAVAVVCRQVGYGSLLGAAAGGAAGGVVVLAARRDLVAEPWLELVPLVAALLGYTAAAAVGGSPFIGSFVAGMVFGPLRRRAGVATGAITEQLGALLGAATFVVFGAALLEPALGDVTWQLLLYAVLSLTLVRMVPVAVALVGTGARPRTVAFVGWFGPRGLASIVFAVLLVEAEGTLPHEATVTAAVFVTVGLSVLVHGATAAPLARRYSAWISANPRAHVEAVTAAPTPPGTYSERAVRDPGTGRARARTLP